MSMMNTVAKMAVGFAVAKGMEAVNRRGGIGSVMQDIQGGATSQAGSMGGLGDILGQLTGGSSGKSGGLGGLLGQLTGGSGGATAAASGGLAGLGGLLGSLAGARGGSDASQFEDLLSQGNPAQEPDEEEVAKLMMRAQLYAARSDGDIDPEEKSKLLTALKDADPEDKKQVQDILGEPVDAQKIVQDTPEGLETQVYTMSLNAIDPDNRAEAEYLHKLAQGFDMSPTSVNAIHDGLGAARIYR